MIDKLMFSNVTFMSRAVAIHNKYYNCTQRYLSITCTYTHILYVHVKRSFGSKQNRTITRFDLIAGVLLISYNAAR